MPQTAANFLGGATSGCVSTLLLQPLDVVKTRLQVSPHHLPQRVGAGPAPALALAPASKNPGIADTVRRIIRYDSPAGLWRGVTPTLLRNSLGVGCYFVTLNHLSTLLARPDGSLSDSATLVAGASARSLVVAVLCPLSVVKTRLELVEYSSSYRGVCDALAQISRQEGVRGLYSGLVPAIVRDAPYSALFFLTYLRTKQALNNFVGLSTSSNIISQVPSPPPTPPPPTRAPTGGPSGADALPPPGDLSAVAAPPPPAEPHNAKMLGRAVNFAAGAVGGGLATLLTQPQDVVKTRMQVRSHRAATVGSPQQNPVHAAIAGRYKRTTVAETVRAVFAEEGLVGFFRGASPRFLKRILGSAITWMIYEESVRAYAVLFPSTVSMPTSPSEVAGKPPSARSNGDVSKAAGGGDPPETPR